MSYRNRETNLVTMVKTTGPTAVATMDSDHSIITRKQTISVSVLKLSMTECVQCRRS